MAVWNASGHQTRPGNQCRAQLWRGIGGSRAVSRVFRSQAVGQALFQALLNPQTLSKPVSHFRPPSVPIPVMLNITNSNGWTVHRHWKTRPMRIRQQRPVFIPLEAAAQDWHSNTTLLEPGARCQVHFLMFAACRCQRHRRISQPRITWSPVHKPLSSRRETLQSIQCCCQRGRHGVAKRRATW